MEAREAPIIDLQHELQIQIEESSRRLKNFSAMDALLPVKTKGRIAKRAIIGKSIVIVRLMFSNKFVHTSTLKFIKRFLGLLSIVLLENELAVNHYYPQQSKNVKDSFN